MTDNVDRMKNRVLKGHVVRKLFGERLSDTLRIYSGMQFNIDTLRVLIEQSFVDTEMDFSHVLEVKYCAKDTPVQRLEDIPNLRLRDEVRGRNEYFLIKPAHEMPWSEYNDSIPCIYRALAPVLLGRVLDNIGMKRPNEFEPKVRETLTYIAPTFWFDYNFVSKRFSIRLRNGVVVRRMKPSQYDLFKKAPKLAIQFGGHAEYALVMSMCKDVTPGFWLDRADRSFTDALANEMHGHLLSSGWTTDVSVMTTPSMLDGYIAAYEPQAE